MKRRLYRTLACLLLVLTSWSAEAATVGEFSLPEVLPLTEHQLDVLRELVDKDKEAAAIAKRVKERASDSIGIEPTPLEVIHYEGLVNTDPRRIETVDSLRQMNDAGWLQRHWQLSGDDRAAATLRDLILAWAETYEITGNDVNENKFTPLLVAYYELRDSFDPDGRQRVDAWVRELGQAHVDAVENAKRFTNRYAKSLRLVAITGLILDRQPWLELAREGVKKQVTKSLRADGTSVDLEHRDSLGYHGSALEPLLDLAVLMGPEGQALYEWEGPEGGSIEKSVQYLVPYSTGEKQHKEWVNTRVGLDRKRAAAGLEKYQTGSLYDPQDGLDVMEAASVFDPSLIDVVRQLSDDDAKRFPTWRVLINTAATSGSQPVKPNPTPVTISE